MVPDTSPVAAEDIAPARLESEGQLGIELIRLVRLLSRLGSQLASREHDGVESAAYALLAHLVIDGPHRTTALAEAVHSDTSTVSRQVGALVRLGLVERRQDPDDGRASLLAATEHGVDVFERNRRRRDAHLATMLSDWSPAEVDTFVHQLGCFNTRFEKYRAELLGGDAEHGAERGSEPP